MGATDDQSDEKIAGRTEETESRRKRKDEMENREEASKEEVEPLIVPWADGSSRVAFLGSHPAQGLRSRRA